MSATVAEHSVAALDTPIGNRLTQWLWPILLLCIALLPFEPFFNVPMVLLAAGGVYALVVLRRAKTSIDGIGFFTAMFLCLWLPMLISSVDALNLGEALRKTTSFLAFYPVGVCVIAFSAGQWRPDRLALGVLLVTSFWVLDAVVQLAFGADLFGFPRFKVRLTGIFYPKYTLGIVLAVLAPFVFEAIRLLWVRRPWVSLVLLPYMLVIVLAGSRSSWTIFSIACAGFVFYLVRYCDTKLPKGRTLVTLCVAAAVLVGMTAALAPETTSKVSRYIEKRIERTTPLMSGDIEKIDKALARRISLWRTAANIIETHWINGVGPRGYRYVYAEFAPDDDYFQKGALKGLPTFPHQVMLEIGVETGMIGLVGYALFLFLFFRKLTSLNRAELSVVFPAATAVFVSVFPLNVHKSFYGSFSSTLMWWTIVVFMAALQSRDEQCDSSVPVRTRQ